MARYNLFKGKSRGSIGDVTFSTQNGIQISRVRNRHPRNPRTNAQMFQRAIWATIIRIYSYGKAIFSTSFESAATPKQAMTAFMSANLDYLRELIITEIDNNTPADQQRGRVVHPQSYTPVPIDGLIVSQGTLTDTIFTVNPATEEQTLQVSMPAPASATETLTQYAQRIGLTEEITYTIMANIVDKDINILYPVKINSPYAINYQSYFGAVRLTLKHLLSEKPISQATIADLFDIVSIGNTFTPSFNDIAFGTGTWNATTLLRNLNAMGTLAVSAYNTTTQQVSNSAMNWIRLYNPYGIISEYAIQIWGKVVQTTNNGYIPEEPKPYDYEIEYLEVNENSGLAYLDTGYIPNNTNVILKTKIYIYTIEQTFSNWPFINSNYNDAINTFGLVIASQTRFLAVSPQHFRGIFNAIFDTEFNLIIDGNNSKIYVDSQEIDMTKRAQSQTSSTLILFNSRANAKVYGRIYNFSLIENGVLIFDMIPVEKNGIGYMYNKVDGKLLAAEGGGTFNLGPRI